MLSLSRAPAALALVLAGACATQPTGEYNPHVPEARRLLFPVLDGEQLEWPRYPADVYDPRVAQRAMPQQKEKLVRDHAATAGELSAYAEGACAAFEGPVRGSCPLLGQVASVHRLPDGVRLTPKRGVNVEAWRAHIVCHLAFAQEKGRAGMRSCPLGLHDLRAEAVGDAIDLRCGDPVTVAQLQALAQEHAD